MIDAKAFGAELAGIVKAATTPLLQRIDALEKRLDALPAPRDGKDADPEAVAALTVERMTAGLAEAEARMVKATRKMIDDSRPAPVETVSADEIKAMVEKAVAAIPAPQNGKDGAPGEKGEATAT